MKLSRLLISNTPMKFRFPFKDYALRWKDDATMTEKLFWGGISSTLGLIIGNLIF
jgi:hypothetical protein